MPPKQVQSFDHREFQVVVAKNDDGSFVAIGRDKNRREIARVSAGSESDAAQNIRRELNEKSSDFVDINGAINLFRKPFPEDFVDPFFKEWEGDYKENARVFVADVMDKEELSKLIDNGDFEAVCTRALRSVQKTNLVSPFEKAKLKDFVTAEKNKEPFALNVFDLLYGDDFEHALEVFADTLSKGDAAKWPIVTYLPFFCFPDRHMFMKPEVVQITAYRLGFELVYDTKPNSASYHSLLQLTDFIREGISTMNPSSNIDIQSFMYVVGKEGYVAESLKGREEWEASQPNH